ncbi:MAG: sirohydrochlorin cobaltochelatase [Negativicutes bacterium]|nr:sirohydrochlorin cobaltochelatase [Negativicutes bacterium]
MSLRVKKALALLATACLVTTGLGSGSMRTQRKKAIVVTSFGTTFPKTRKACIESVENDMREIFPEYEIRRAFTARQVIAKIAAEEKLQIDTLEQALCKLKEEGYQEVVIQPLHLTPGEEYEKKILSVYRQYVSDKSFDVLTIGRPILMFDGQRGMPDDFTALAEAVEQQMPGLAAEEAVLFMGHGSPNQPNPAYGKMQRVLQARGHKAYMGVVEENDHPNFEDALAELKKNQVKKVILMPFMLVAGDHVQNDMAGDEPDSWKNLLEKDGFQVEVELKGLGENAAYRSLYMKHARDAIRGLYQP